MPTVACSKRAGVLSAALLTGLLLGCADTKEYQLGQRIDMGPYTFEVASVQPGRWASVATINVSFNLLRDDTAPFTTDFWESFVYKMELVDRAGNAFPVDPHPVSPVYEKGRQRSNRYRAEVRLSPSHEGVRDAANIGKSTSDFTLMIANPAPQDGQPRRVSIQLP